MSKRSKARRNELIRSMQGLEVLKEKPQAKSFRWNRWELGIAVGIIAGALFIWLV